MRTQRTVAREVAAEQWTGRGEVVLHRTSDGAVGMDVRLEQDTVWLDAHQMALLFERNRSVVVRHIGNVSEGGELESAATCAKKMHRLRPTESSAEWTSTTLT